MFTLMASQGSRYHFPASLEILAIHFKLNLKIILLQRAASLDDGQEIKCYLMLSCYCQTQYKNVFNRNTDGNLLFLYSTLIFVSCRESKASEFCKRLFLFVFVSECTNCFVCPSMEKPSWQGARWLKCLMLAQNNYNVSIFKTTRKLFKLF